jgi:iron only hydrogenase large subunit-like protein
MEEGTELLQRLKAATAAASNDGAATSSTTSSGSSSTTQPPPSPGYGAAGAAREASHAAGPLPLFTSCCPGWVSLVEQEFPEFIPNLSSCKSPQQMLGAVVKEVWAPRHGLKVCWCVFGGVVGGVVFVYRRACWF